MKKEVKEALNTLKTFLGMEIKLEQMKLKDGVTVLEFEVLEILTYGKRHIGDGF